MAEQTNFLNLDDVVEASRTIKLFGKTYAVAEVGLGELLADIRAAEAEAETVGDDAVRNMEGMLDVIERRIPGCPRSELNRLSSPKVMHLLKWLNKSPEQAAAEVAASAEKEQTAGEGAEAKN